MALNGKRMQTFFNEFLITTTSFLNQFASNCEEKFFEFERKLNKIESNLLIVEQKLASVPTAEDKPKPAPEADKLNLPDVESLKLPEPAKERPSEIKEEEPPRPLEDVQKQEEPTGTDQNLIKISESATYKKYFKMLKFGINLLAVKQKMSSEGFDSDLLDNGELMIEKSPQDYEEQEEE